MNRHLKSILLAALLAVLTVLFCIVVADGFIGLKGIKVDHGDGTGVIYTEAKLGLVVFWIFMVGLTLLFARYVKWVYTIPNLLWYFLLYFPPYYGFGNALNHGLLRSGGFLVFPAWVNAVLTAIGFFLIQTFAYFCYNIVCGVIRAINNRRRINGPADCA